VTSPKPKASKILIDDLFHYTAETSAWWYNHIDRCKDFRPVFIQADKNQRKKLVQNQYLLFTQPSTIVNNQAQEKYLQPLKQGSVQDGYFEAIKKCQATYESKQKVNEEAPVIQVKRF
jgi:hypothetical protein